MLAQALQQSSSVKALEQKQNELAEKLKIERQDCNAETPCGMASSIIEELTLFDQLSI